MAVCFHPRRAEHQQVLLAGLPFYMPAHVCRQPGIVAYFGVGIERQVVAGHIDVVPDQRGDAAVLPAGDGDRLAFPKQAVVHQEHIGILRHGIIDGGLAGGNGTHDFMYFFPPLHLQAVGGVVVKFGGTQKFVAPADDVLTLRHGWTP